MREVNMEERIGGYVCKDERGNTVKVYEYQEMIDATAHGDAERKYLPGLKRLQLENGHAVNKIDDATLQVVATGEKLTVVSK
jgi:hypothetical protein